MGWQAQRHVAEEERNHSPHGLWVTVATGMDRLVLFGAPGFCALFSAFAVSRSPQTNRCGAAPSVAKPRKASEPRCAPAMQEAPMGPAACFGQYKGCSFPWQSLRLSLIHHPRPRRGHEAWKLSFRMYKLQRATLLGKSVLFWEKKTLRVFHLSNKALYFMPASDAFEKKRWIPIPNTKRDDCIFTSMKTIKIDHSRR